MKQRNCAARSSQNNRRLATKTNNSKWFRPGIVIKPLSTPNVSCKKYAEPYYRTFPSRLYPTFLINVPVFSPHGKRYTFNQRQKRRNYRRIA